MKDRAYDIARNHKYDGYERAFARIVYKFSERKTGSGLIVTSKIGVNINKKLAKDLCKPVIRKLKRRKVYKRFKDNIWAAIYLKWDHCLLWTKMLKIYYVP